MSRGPPNVQATDRAIASALGRMSVLVLLYHGVRPDDAQPATTNLQAKHVSQSAFAAQMDWLIGAGYRFIDGDELRWMSKARSLPRGPAVAITFDDGYANNHSCALPVLRPREIPALVFLVGAFVDRGEPLWVDRLEQAVMSARVPELTVDLNGARRTLTLAGAPARKAAESSVRSYCKRLPATARESVLQELFAGLDAPSSPLPALYRPLRWDEIDDLRHAGWTIGSHTMTHTILAGLTAAQARREVGEAKALLEARLGVQCDLFAYPNGLRGDFTEETQRVLAGLGKTCALASVEGRVTRRFEPLAMRRVAVHDRMGLAEFKVRTTGAVGVAKSVKAGLRTAQSALRRRRAG